MSEAPEANLARVEWRVQGKIDAGGGVTVVAYLDGVYVAELLDGWVGNGNWYDRYEPAHSKGLWCHLSVRIGDEWITKVDVGVPSQQESEKGLVSDAFKRAAMRKWRVGHNVYTLPTIRLQRDQFREHDGKAYLNDASDMAIGKRLEGLGLGKVGTVNTSEPDETPAPRAKPSNRLPDAVMDEHKARIVAALDKAKIPRRAFVDYLASEGFASWGEVPPNQRSAMADGATKGVLLDDVREYVKDAA